MYLLPILLRCLLALFGVEVPDHPWRAACEIAPPMNEPSRPGLPLPERDSRGPVELAWDSLPPG
jgi:hypothetical protein